MVCPKEVHQWQEGIYPRIQERRNRASLVPKYSKVNPIFCPCDSALAPMCFLTKLGANSVKLLFPTDFAPTLHRLWYGGSTDLHRKNCLGKSDDSTIKTQYTKQSASCLSSSFHLELVRSLDGTVCRECHIPYDEVP